jgi:CMP-N-acetylneuraminic acid synthetase
MYVTSDVEKILEVAEEFGAKTHLQDDDADLKNRPWCTTNNC